MVNGKINSGNHPYNLELVPDTTKKIVITTDGKTTLARLYDGKTVVRSAKAKCSPDDTFDFDTGAKLAMERLMATTPTEQKKHPAVGDLIRVIFDKRSNPGKCIHWLSEGQILKVDRVHKNSDIEVYGYSFGCHDFVTQIMLPGEYEIL